MRLLVWLLAFQSPWKTHIHSISAGRLFACMTFSQSPEKRVRQSVFFHIYKDLIINFKSGEVGCLLCQ